MDELNRCSGDNFLTNGVSPSVESILYGFLGNLKSPHTRIAYKRDLQIFSQFLLKRFPELTFLTVKQVHLVAFRNYLQRNGGRKENSPSEVKTVNRRISCLKKFYRYLCQSEILEKNPAEFVDLLKIPSMVRTEALTEDQWQKILKVSRKSDFTTLFHHSVICLLFTTGMRKSELINLKVKNLQQKGEFLILEYMAKGSKKIIKPLNDICKASLLLYLKKCREKGFTFNEDDYLLRAEKKSANKISLDDRLAPSTVDYIVKKAGEGIGIDSKKMHVHMARATVITLLNKKGVDLKTIQDFVGHSYAQMTIEYIKREKSIQESPSFLLI